MARGDGDRGHMTVRIGRMGMHGLSVANAKALLDLELPKRHGDGEPCAGVLFVLLCTLRSLVMT